MCSIIARSLNVSLVRFFAESKKVKVIRVFQKALRQIRLRLRQSQLKICQRLALSLIKIALNLQRQNIAAPTVGDGFTNVKLALLWVFDRIQNANIVAPGNLSNNLLDELLLFVSLCKSPHIKQVRPRKAFHFWKLAPQIFRKTLHDLRAPTKLLLFPQNLAPNLP